MIKKEQNKAITLVALVITIIILLILSGVTIASLSGENGIITNAIKAKKMTTLSQCKEEYEMFITEEMIKNNEFQKTSLAAGETNLIYNTQKPDETGNIYTIMPSLKNNEYSQKLEIIKGDLLLNTKDPKEIELAKSIGIKPNPYDIVNGELLSSNGNLLLMDETGTLTIPDSVNKIGDGAFRGLNGLKTIIIPGSVKEIGNDAFSGNLTLENVILESGVEKIGENAFKDCTSLKTFNMSNTIKSLGVYCFYNCKNLSTVNISNNITIIPGGCFECCSSLNKITLSEGIKKIEWLSFANCIHLQQINIPETCEYIAGSSFNKNYNLKNIIINPNNNFFYMENGLLLSKNKDTLFLTLPYKTELIIPNTVTILENGSISSAEKITSLFIPSQVIKINSSFPSNIKKIEVDINNKNYKSINNNLYDFNGETLLKYCTNESIVTIPEGVKKINAYAFNGQSNIKKLNLAESVEIIENWAITYNNLDLYIGKNLNYITSIGLNGNINVTISSENPNLMTPDGTLILSKDTKKLIASTKNLSTYNIPNSVEYIAPHSFYSKYNLTEILLPNNIIDIGSCAFQNDGNLRKIIIPNSIKSIGHNTFNNCNNLREIIIDKPKNSIPGAPWGNPFGLRAIKWLE